MVLLHCARCLVTKQFVVRLSLLREQFVPMLIRIFSYSFYLLLRGTPSPHRGVRFARGSTRQRIENVGYSNFRGTMLSLDVNGPTDTVATCYDGV